MNNETDIDHLSRMMIMHAGNGNLENVKEYLKEGADIQWSNNLALRRAAENGDREMIRYLCTHGANIRAALCELAPTGAGSCGHVKGTAYLLDYASKRDMAFVKTLRAAFGYLAMLEAAEIPIEHAPDPAFNAPMPYMERDKLGIPPVERKPITIPGFAPKPK